MPDHLAMVSAPVQVVLFSGGRGSGALTKQLIANPNIQLTLAINGYDDGASTGEVRRFLGDALGPSDFRKNASRLAAELGTCPQALVDLLDTRLADGITADAAVTELRRRAAGMPRVAERLEHFIQELERGGQPFDFADCSIGNLVFAGCYLRTGRRFNDALDDYCALLGIPPGTILNVTDGADAHLVAIAEDGSILGSEEEIVGAGQNQIRDIYLLKTRLGSADRARLSGLPLPEVERFFREAQAPVAINPRLVERLASAQLIVYAPGTQHSSLFPSYLTPGLGAAIAGNLRAIKLLVTNIQTDAEIAGRSAVDIIDRALYYLNEKGARSLPTPCLITHYLVNDPGQLEADAPYVPLGQIETLEDPRLVRVANFEEGISGRHDAAKILGPFLQSLVQRPARQRLAVLLYGTTSQNKITQTLLEMVRGGIGDLNVEVSAFYDGPPLDRSFTALLPFSVRPFTAPARFEEIAGTSGADYVVLFESSGMYRGEDVAALASHLASGRLDAAWGSRRLSVRDIETSIRLRYQRSPLFGTLSAVGSHVLSLACLLLYGRYVSDTLSGVRALRLEDVLRAGVPATHPHFNQRVLGRLLRRKAELLEIPVHFLALSPDRVRRTTLAGGLGALLTLVRARFAPAAVMPAGAGQTSAEKRRTDPVASR